MDLERRDASSPLPSRPRPGPQQAVPATPPRVPGSVRRTKSIDVTRPDGLLGRIVADARGQDVHTDAAGAGHVVARVALTVEIDPTSGEILSIAPSHPHGHSAREGPSRPTDDPARTEGPSDREGSTRPTDSPAGNEGPSGLSASRGGTEGPSDREGSSGLGDGRGGGAAAESGREPGRLAGLVGASARSGFGRRLAEVLAEERERRTLLYSVLEDLSGALLVSGYSLLRAGAIQPSPERGEQMARFQADVCIGWARGGPLLETMRHDGISAVPFGPAAPAIEGDDPLGWHPMAPLAPGTVRRRRRLDLVAVAPEAGAEEGHVTLVAQSHFRDSYAGDGDGDGEMVMHEYLVDTETEVDAGAAAGGRPRIARVEVDPRVLPWSECPGAVASAQRIVGLAVDDLPASARTELTGPSTCTHLTSTLRSLADLPALARLLGPPSR